MRNFKKLILPLLIGIILGVNTMAVYSASAMSPDLSYGPHLGYSYKGCSSVFTFTDGATANTSVHHDGSGDVPAGYMGVQVNLMRESDGAIASSTSWSYNSFACYAIGDGTGYATTSDAYYGQGFARAYNGNGYSTYALYRSPSLNY